MSPGFLAGNGGGDETLRHCCLNMRRWIGKGGRVEGTKGCGGGPDWMRMKGNWKMRNGKRWERWWVVVQAAWRVAVRVERWEAMREITSGQSLGWRWRKSF